MRTADDLRIYQQFGSQFILTRKRGQLWYDVGYGKTAAVETALNYGFHNLRYIRALVISTKAIASSVWQEELAEWDFTQWLRDKTRSLVGLSPKVREREMFDRRDTRLDSINFAHLPWLCKQLEKRGHGLGMYYDVVVVDEFTKLKNADGTWFRKMAHLVHPDHVPHYWGLSGSPAAEGYKQLWAPMFLVDYGHRLGYTRKQFHDRYFLTIGDKLVLKAGAKEEMLDKLKDVVLSVDKERFPNVVPPLHAHPRYLHMSEQQQGQYLELEREMMLRLKEGDVVAANAGVLCGKTMQYTSGAMFLVDDLGKPTKKWESVHDVKLRDLEAFFESKPGNGNVMVGTGYTHETERILKRFENVAVHMTANNYERVKPEWNAGRIRMLVTHPGSCGHGVNLQKGGNQTYMYTIPFSGELFEQFPGRLARAGQPAGHVDLHAPVFVGTVDEDAWTAGHAKLAIQDVIKARVAAQ